MPVASIVMSDDEHRARIARYDALRAKFFPPPPPPKPVRPAGVVVYLKPIGPVWPRVHFRPTLVPFSVAAPLLPMQTVMDLVHQETGISPTLIIGTRGLGRISCARGIFCYLIRRYGPRSLPAIGRFLGRHHTTVYIAAIKVHAARTVDAELDAMLDRCGAALRGPDHAARYPYVSPGQKR